MIIEEVSALIEHIESGFGKIVKYVKDWSEREVRNEFSPDINIEVPQGKAPVVKVDVPKQAAPRVDVKPTIEVKVPEINVPPAQVVVQGAKRWEFDIKYDNDGDIEKVIATRHD